MVHILLAVIYLAFIGLGLPDALLGCAWPSMYRDFYVPVSYAGGVAIIISLGTIISSLKCEYITAKFGTGKVTAFSTLITAIALFGFAASNNYIAICLWAIPYGLGAGCVDASLNNYVALNYASRHMNWLHCMWGIGCSIGPYVMSYAIGAKQGWSAGYSYIAVFQVILAAMLFLSLPMWKKQTDANGKEKQDKKPTSTREVIKIPGVREIATTFFCYCAIEQTTGLWAASYLVLHSGFSAEKAAGFAGLFFLGITIGRALGGFLTLKLNNTQMIRLGFGIIFCGLVLFLICQNISGTLLGITLIGLGCAPIYPSLIHSTPKYFGVKNSQAIIGIEMATAYTGSCIMPPIFGLIASHFGISTLPLYLLTIFALMLKMHEKLLSKT